MPAEVCLVRRTALLVAEANEHARHASAVAGRSERSAASHGDVRAENDRPTAAPLAAIGERA